MLYKKYLSYQVLKIEILKHQNLKELFWKALSIIAKNILWFIKNITKIINYSYKAVSVKIKKIY